VSRTSFYMLKTAKWLLVMAVILSGTLLLPIRQAIGTEDDTAVIDDFIEEMLSSAEGQAELVVGSWRLGLEADTIRFYREREFRPAWIDEGGVLPVAQDLVAFLGEISREGLEPAEYHLECILTGLELARVFQAYEAGSDAGGLARLDVLLTNSFLRLATHLSVGRFNPMKVYASEWQAPKHAPDPVVVLNDALAAGEVRQALHPLRPADEGYDKLAHAMARYRQLAAGGGWPSLPTGADVAPGQEDPRLPLLRRILVTLGDLDVNQVSREVFLEEGTATALRRFQQRHGLPATGVLNQETVQEINVPARQRADQIELNLERRRWTPREPGSRHILVDVTDYSLVVKDGGQEAMRMAVVVGTAFRRTPVFSSMLTHIEFAPYWTVPPTIFKEDKWPLIQADVNFLARHNYEIVTRSAKGRRVIDPATIDWSKVTVNNFPGLLRQKPGPWNPLGRVKFLFENSYAVYLHDTPSKELFLQDQRSFSSGCIRLERAEDLAVYLLTSQAGWSREKIVEAMGGEAPRTVWLRRPVPVHILYRTAWVDDAGRLQFRRDIYQRDAVLQQIFQRQNRAGGQQ
jgi:L,D-transpeptidase YcbB